MYFGKLIIKAAWRTCRFDSCVGSVYRNNLVPSAVERDNYDQATSYSKQKDSLQIQLEAFLSALPGQVTLATATPRDLCRFLILKDKDGKTQVHCNSCKFIGQQTLWLPSTIVIQNCGFLHREIEVYFPC